MATKELTEDEAKILWLEGQVKDAENELDIQISLAETNICQLKLAHAMHQWNAKSEELRRFKYMIEREKYFLKGKVISESHRIYIDLSEDDGVM